MPGHKGDNGVSVFQDDGFVRDPHGSGFGSGDGRDVQAVVDHGDLFPGPGREPAFLPQGGGDGQVGLGQGMEKRGVFQLDAPLVRV